MVGLVKGAITYILLSLIGIICANAQTQESVNVSEGGYGLVKTNMNMSYDHGWGAIEDGFAFRVSYQFLKKKQFTVSANIRYTSSEVKFDDSDLIPSQESLPALLEAESLNLNGTHIMTQLGVTSTFRTRVFNRPFSAMAMITGEWGQNGFDRISGIAMGLFMVRSSRNTQFGLGPLVMVNTNSNLPAFLVFMYRHRFNPKWQVLLYGGIFDIEYNPTPNDLICAGADVDVEAFYFKPGIAPLPTKCRFTSTSFRPLLKYRRRLAKNLNFEIMGGVALKMSARITGVSGSKEWIDLNQPPSLFVQAGISYGL